MSLRFALEVPRIPGAGGAAQRAESIRLLKGSVRGLSLDTWVRQWCRLYGLRDAEGAPAGAEPLAPHASEIEFVFRTLASRKLTWRPEQRAVSELMASYWTNFAKTGNPNGASLPSWPVHDPAHEFAVMRFSGGKAAATPDARRERYEFLDRIALGY